MTRSFITLLFVLAACGGEKELDDPQLTASATALGTQSAGLSEMPEDADDATVQSNTQAVGGSLQAIVSQHQAVSGGAGVSAVRRSSARQATADEPVFWDGSELCIDLDIDSAGASIEYDVTLDFAASGASSTVDGTYRLVYDLGVGALAYRYEVDAVYDQLTTEGGCAVSGSITVDYTANLNGGVPGLGGQNQSGRVTATYEGCDMVTVTGT